MALFIEDNLNKTKQNKKTALWFEVYIEHLKDLLVYFNVDKKHIHIIFYQNIHDDWKERYLQFVKAYLPEYAKPQ